nr:hypothetical protein [Corynebacterium ulcerans]
MKHKLGERTYIRIDPAVPNGSLLMYLHGSRQSANVARNFTDRTFDYFAEHGTTVIYPEGISHHWNDARRSFAEQTRLLGTDDVAFLTALAAPYSQVFGVGFSNGAHMLIRLLHDSPGTLAGAASSRQTSPPLLTSSVPQSTGARPRFSPCTALKTLFPPITGGLSTPPAGKSSLSQTPPPTMPGSTA